MKFKHAEEIVKAAEDLQPVVHTSHPIAKTLDITVNREAWRRLQAVLAEVKAWKAEQTRAPKQQKDIYVHQADPLNPITETWSDSRAFQGGNADGF